LTFRFAPGRISGNQLLEEDPGGKPLYHDLATVVFTPAKVVVHRRGGSRPETNWRGLLCSRMSASPERPAGSGDAYDYIPMSPISPTINSSLFAIPAIAIKDYFRIETCWLGRRRTMPQCSLP